ncbi:MAG: endonuclease/exonuclease/phosphatase family protein [Cyclonatronaceae bacterium]
MSFFLWIALPGIATGQTIAGQDNDPHEPAQSTPGSGLQYKTQTLTQTTDTLRVLCYNIHSGRGVDDVYDFRRIADVIIESRADLVALQEVDSGIERSGNVDMMEILAGYTGLKHLFYKNAEIQGGAYGNGILVRHPLVEAANIHLPRVADSEQRGLMHTIVDVNGMPVAFMNTHLDHRPPDEERLKGIGVILETAQNYAGMPVIVAGDLNDRPGSEVYQRMSSRFTDIWVEKGEGDGFTYHTTDPDRRIDYIFFSNEGAVDAGYRLEPISVEVLWSEGSDHLPLLAVFLIKK